MGRVVFNSSKLFIKMVIIFLDTLDIVYQLPESKLMSQMAHSQRFTGFPVKSEQGMQQGGSFHNTIHNVSKS